MSDRKRGPKRPHGTTRAKVLEMKQAGMGARDIAAALDVSTQVVHYHLGKAKASGETTSGISTADARRYLTLRKETA